MRALIAIVVTLLGGVAHADKFCASPHAVDRVTTELVCPEATYPGSVLVRTLAGWDATSGYGTSALGADETAHLDRWLVDGVAAVCAGSGDAALMYPSLHRKEYGWPLERCRRAGAHRLILGKGALRLALPAPRVVELAQVYFLVRIHDLGRRLVWP